MKNISPCGLEGKVRRSISGQYRRKQKTVSATSQNARTENRTVVEILFLLGMFAIFLFGHQQPSVRNLITVFAGIVLEALPFMLLGALAGGLIEVYVSRDKLLDRLPAGQWKGVMAAAALGMLCPVCECAVIPVVRRLLGKGVPVPAAIAFLLGAPLVNPVVGVSTAAAYSFTLPVALLRLIVGYGIAVTTALLMGKFFPEREALVETGAKKHSHSCGCGCGHIDHLHIHTTRQRFLNAFRHASDDFVDVGQFLVMGAFVAALFQTVIPRGSLSQLAATPGLAVVVMMGLAVLLNICSEADAFIAASFRNIVPFSAQMAFMLLGPMLDLKLVFMFTTVFRRKAIAALALILVAAVWLTSLGLQQILPGGLP